MAAVPWTRNDDSTARQTARVQEFVDRVRPNAGETRLALQKVYQAYAATVARRPR
ncbi:hypothetical protein [Caulobacter hibisci]|uniref:Uncharacterized protein n=1 Tax=Caulobacter hibisci TaxID=2035993 RepID=A0ABS0T2Z5_9CAUL|nr:hypothetical protein [Caulobacter hibisci]MBI1685222.1 hypothetical protein [Caulobacter hibisci]